MKQRFIILITFYRRININFLLQINMSAGKNQLLLFIYKLLQISYSFALIAAKHSILLTEHKVVRNQNNLLYAKQIKKTIIRVK